MRETVLTVLRFFRSATLDYMDYSAYFTRNASLCRSTLLKIPGQMYDVEEHYLDSILHLLGAGIPG